MVNFIILFCSSNIILAQFSDNDKHIPNIFAKNPNVGSLGSFGETNMNLAIGLPDINFDLFSINAGNNAFNISLRYDASYVKPDNIPSWVGLGWSLNSSGMINRVLNGEVDELGYYSNYNTLAVGDWDSDSKMKNYSENAISTELNSTPDIFEFSVNNINGKFFKNHEGKWIVSSNDQDLKITDIIKSNDFGMSKFIYSFTIIDCKGNEYTFGNTPESVEIFKLRKKYTEGTEIQYYYYVKNWHLTKIKFDNAKVIEFVYNKSGKIYYKQSLSYYMKYYFKNWNGYKGCHMYTDINFNDCYNNLVNYEEGDMSYLYKIMFDSGEAIFNRSIANSLEYNNKGYSVFSYTNPDANYYSNKHWYKLDNIVVNNKNTTVKKITFNYDENPTQRLKLKSFAIGKDSDSKQNFAFEYNPQLFPPFNNNNNDHWGFFNGRSFNTQSLDPNNIDENAQYFYQSKEPQFYKNELLEKITYPTLGYTKFNYEPNNYSKVINYNNGFNLSTVDNTNTGGVRLKEMIINDGLTDRKKQYFYVDDFFNNSSKSTGVLSILPNYLGGSAYIARIFSSIPLSPLNDTRGSHILYSKVFEKEENGGIIEYAFTNSDNGYMDLKENNIAIGAQYQVGTAMANGTIYWGSMANEYYPNSSFFKSFNSLAQERGKLLHKTEYDATRNKIRETEYEYNSETSRFNKNVRILKVDYNKHGIFKELAPSNTPQYNYRYYASIINISASSYFFYNHYLKSETTTDYLDNKQITTLKKYFYNSNLHNQMTNAETTFSNGTKELIYYKYAYDDENNNQTLIFRNAIGIPLLKEVHRNIDGIDKIISKIETKYLNTAIYRDHILPISIISYDINNILTVANKITFDRYDNKGNLLQYSNIEGVPVAIIWGYNQTYPIAKVVGGSYPRDPSFQTPEPINEISNVGSVMDLSNQDELDLSKEINLQTALDDLRKQPKLLNTQITTYTYDPLIGVTSITSPNGIRENYVYDTANRLKEIKDTNGNILKEYKYNYIPQKYYNIAKSQSFTKNNCTSGYLGSSYTYTVPAGKYMSIVSQANADQMAQNDIDANGQTTANTNGTCYENHCTITAAYYLTIYYSSFQEVTTNHVKGILSLPIASGFDWTAGVNIGTLGATCRPQEWKEIQNISAENGSKWNIVIYDNGATILYLKSGSAPSSGQSITLYFEYDK